MYLDVKSIVKCEMSVSEKHQYKKYTVNFFSGLLDISKRNTNILSFQLNG